MKSIGKGTTGTRDELLLDGEDPVKGRLTGKEKKKRSDSPYT